jgi:hypothetical protein
MVVLSMIVMQCAARRHLGLLNATALRRSSSSLLREAPSSAPRNRKRPIVVLNLLPQPSFLEDHLQHAELAVDEIGTGSLSSFILISAYSGDCDVT